MSQSVTVLIAMIGAIGILLAIAMISVGCVLDFSAKNRELAKSLMRSGATIALVSIAAMGVVGALQNTDGPMWGKLAVIMLLVTATFAFDWVFRKRRPPK